MKPNFRHHAMMHHLSKHIDSKIVQKTIPAMRRGKQTTETISTAEYDLQEAIEHLESFKSSPMRIMWLDMLYKLRRKNMGQYGQDKW